MNFKKPKILLYTIKKYCKIKTNFVCSKAVAVNVHVKRKYVIYYLKHGI